MRVIAGTARSLFLKTPAGIDTRPTTDRIKETLFNMIQSNLADCIFVDLFSGSGSIGIEALSRGAKKAYFAENNKAAAACISENLKSTGLEQNAVLLKQDAVSSLSSIREPQADIIYMDPPYGEGLEEKVVEALAKMPYLTLNTIVIIEAVREKDFSFVNKWGFEITREKNYKTNKHIFLKKQGD